MVEAAMVNWNVVNLGFNYVCGMGDSSISYVIDPMQYALVIQLIRNI